MSQQQQLQELQQAALDAINTMLRFTVRVSAMYGVAHSAVVPPAASAAAPPAASSVPLAAESVGEDANFKCAGLVLEGKPCPNNTPKHRQKSNKKVKIPPTKPGGKGKMVTVCIACDAAALAKRRADRKLASKKRPRDEEADQQSRIEEYQEREEEEEEEEEDDRIVLRDNDDDEEEDAPNDLNM